MSPSKVLQPPIVTIRSSAAETIRSRTTVARVAITAGLSRLGCVTITPSGAFLPKVEAISSMTLQSRAVLMQPSGRGGTGRHAGLRSQWAFALGGSSPSARTKFALWKPTAPKGGCGRSGRSSGPVGSPGRLGPGDGSLTGPGDRIGLQIILIAD